MPLIKLDTSVELTADQNQKLLSDLSRIVAEVTGKPETYVMATVQHASICMGGSVVPAAFVDVRGIGGLNSAVNKKLSKAICDCLSTSLGIATDKVYLNFTDVSASNWGWNGGTF